MSSFSTASKICQITASNSTLLHFTCVS